jgi:hypothetical protein
VVGRQTDGESATAAIRELAGVLLRSAKGSEEYAKCLEEAEREGDRDLLEFFRKLEEQDAQKKSRESGA